MSKCTSWLGHKFEGRWSVIGQKYHFPSWANVSINGPAYQEVYEGDVCVRCGTFVKNIRETLTDATQTAE